MRYTLALATAVILISGCAGTKPSVPANQVIEKRSDVSDLTIFAPHTYNPSASNPFIYYDYYLDCKDDKCKIGKMKYGQYITVSIPYGSHSVFIKPSRDGFMNAILVAGGDDIIERNISIQPNKPHFISHTWEQSFGRYLLGLLATPQSTMQELPEEYGKAELNELLQKHETFGGRLNDYGVKGITYRP